MQGSGLHDVAMGDQRSALIRAAQGILWLGRHALRVHCAVMDRGTGPSARAALAEQPVIARRGAGSAKV
jgi:hypothetical protein